MNLRDLIRLMPAARRLRRAEKTGTRFIAVDFESANNNPCSVCAVGYAIAERGRVVTTGHWYCRPYPDYFEPASIQVHGIRPCDIQDAPTFADILVRLRAIAGDRPWVAHNSGSEASSVRDFCARKGTSPPDNPILCSQRLYERYAPGRKAGLAAASAALGIRLDQHDAQSDAKASAEIVNRILLESGETDLTALTTRYGVSMAPISSRVHLPKRDRDLSRITIPLPREAAGEFREGRGRPLHPFFGTVLSIDGDIDGMSRAEVERAVREKGGRVVRGVNYMTNYFVSGRQPPVPVETTPPAPAPSHGTSHPHAHARPGGPVHPHGHEHVHAVDGAHPPGRPASRGRKGALGGPGSGVSREGGKTARRSKAEALNQEGRRIRILDEKQFLALLRQ